MSQYSGDVSYVVVFMDTFSGDVNNLATVDRKTDLEGKAISYV